MPTKKPKTPEDVRSLARSHTDMAIRVLAGIARQPKAAPSARQAAAQALLDRGWGRPAQVIEGNPDQPMKLVVEIIDPTKDE